MANFFDAFPDAAYTLNDSFFAGDKGRVAGNMACHTAQGVGEHPSDGS